MLRMFYSGRRFVMNQLEYFKTNEKIEIEIHTSFKQFWSICQQCAYATFSTVRCALVLVALLFTFTKHKFKEKEKGINSLRKPYTLLRTETSLHSLTFIHNTPANITRVVCEEATFAVNICESSPMGIREVIQNNVVGLVNVIHHSSSKSSWVWK